MKIYRESLSTFRRIVAIGAEPHVNTCFKHFHYFVTEFNLLPAKEMEPLVELVKQICKDWSVARDALNMNNNQMTTTNTSPELDA